MKTKNLILALAFALPFGGFSTLDHQPEVLLGETKRPDLRKIDNKAFQKGEYLKFRLHYGLVNAGEAELEVKEVISRQGRSAFHIVGEGGSVGMFNWFYKVDDRYETYLDTEAIMPWEFVRDVYEGGYEINRHIKFNQYDNWAESDGLYYEVPPYVQDIFSAFYYSRTMDVSDLKIGDMLEIQTFLDHEIYPLKLKYLGDEIVKSDVGKVKCMKFRPYVQAGRVFKEADDMSIWVSADANHIPIRMQSDLLIGSIRMDLTEYKNLKNKLALVN